MTWMSVQEAATALAVSTRTIETRIKRQTIPSYLDSETGARRVWTGPAPEAPELWHEERNRHREERLRWAEVLADQTAALETLQAEVKELRQALKKENRRPASAATARDRSRPSVPVAKGPKADFGSSRPGPIRADTPTEVLELLELASRSGLSNREICRRSGVSKNMLAKIKARVVRGQAIGTDRGGRQRLLSFLRDFLRGAEPSDRLAG